MNDNPIITADSPRCPECAAQLTKLDETCWLCGATVRPDQIKNDEIILATGVASPASFTLEELMAAVTLIAVCLGLFTIYPGLAILLSIILSPVFLRTVLVVRRREALGLPVSPARKAWLFIGSFFTTVVILVLVTVASIGTFCAICLGAGTEKAIPIAAMVGGITTILAIITSVAWIRWRWRRHTRV